MTDITFLGASTGFVVTEPAGASLDGSGSGRIQRSLDRGRSWTSVWQRRRVMLTWIGFGDGRHGFAAGFSIPPRPSQTKARPPLLVRTSDGGGSWQELTPRLPPRPSLPGRR